MLLAHLTAAAMALLGAQPVLAWQPDYILRVTQTTLTADCHPRLSVVINGTSPGPLLRMQEGQHYWIRVYNDLPADNTTIHWHGFSQYLSPYSDGTPLGSGWPIPAGHFYDYEFQLEDGFIGTYWYHSHVDTQSQTANGPIIVEPKDTDQGGCPVEYDEELVLMTNDYYHATDPTQVMGLLNDTFLWVGDPQALLVNGHGPNRCNASALPPGEVCAQKWSCGLAQMFVKPATRYRVRVIATGALSYLQLKLEGHEMKVFEVDGTYIEPIPIDDLQIQIGQRYSVLIETLAEPAQKDYYWRLRSMWRPTRTHGAALWTYIEADPSSSPSSSSASLGPDDKVFPQTFTSVDIPSDIAHRVPLQNETFGWIDDQFRMYYGNNSTDRASQQHYPPDEAVTRRIWLNNRQIQWGADGKALRWAVNGRLYDSSVPTTPILLNIYDKSIKPDYEAAAANSGYDPTSQTYPVKRGEVLDIIIEALPGPSGLVEAHPWHSHGAKYWDMGAGTGNFSYKALAASLRNRTGSPIKRDTSVAYPGPGASYLNQTIPADGAGGWRLLRIQVEDPGLWLLHCHILFHQVMVPLLYAGEDLPPIPPSLLQEYTTFGGGAFGQTTYDPGADVASGNGPDGYSPTSYFVV